MRRYEVGSKIKDIRLKNRNWELGILEGKLDIINFTNQ